MAMTAISASASDVVLDVWTARIGAKIPATMYGIFFEDINYGADGGLYAEMIKNRSFEFPQNLQGWKALGDIRVMDDGPFDKNPHYVRMTPSGHREKATAIENEGFFGVSFEKGKKYRFSLWARVPYGGSDKIRVELCDPASDIDWTDMARAEITVNSGEWKKYSVMLEPSHTAEAGVLRLFLDRNAKHPVDVEHISLFPEDTWKGHENGMRRDLAQALAELKPGVFRFPGGCIVEGTTEKDRYQWKNTVGPVENRPVNRNRWEDCFTNRLATDYYQSGGLGFYDYFLLAEEIGAAPLPVLNVGMVCQYQNNPEDHTPLDSLESYIQDALDLVEFANGDVSTKWGALRAEMGHPAPFGLKYMAVGNEQWGPEYVKHLAPFVKAIRKQHPEIKIIGSSGPGVDDDKFNYLWPEMADLGVDLVDEHYYRNEDWFLDNAARYDSYSRKNPKVFAGEYACHPKGNKRNLYKGALSEAAFMTGLERNADIVNMCTYAPLFANINGWQWRPDLIWFDNFNTLLTDSYEIQRLYSRYKGTDVIPVTMNGKPAAGKDGQQGIYASGVRDSNTDSYIVKVANVKDEDCNLTLNIDRLPKYKSVTAIERTLFTEDPAKKGGLHSSVITTDMVTATAGAKKGSSVINDTLPAQSFAIYKVSMK